MCRRCGCLSSSERTVRSAPVEGMLEAAALLACGERPQYGYELSTWLAGENLVAGVVSPGRLYENLANLESIGALIVDREPGEKGPDRRRYRLTALGHARLERWLESLALSDAALRRLLGRSRRTPHLISQRTEGGETMSCNCNCNCKGDGQSEGRKHHETDQQVNVTNAPSRSVEERLQVIEDLLRHSDH